ncbi:hypothetical protein Q3O60_04785 [Alkalimonas collagenimarina]|uniref:Uncharacterized protein n=1 Tax=Alkalimonas collagenimarina TaxID=400390 RepID=A0ABT9GWR3_9GAMM|nr:hypothetical protein [Alkalimonas collagenimarina]MDP4535506.1 hypothetical protein [Alkalimonas collagenimarina]
MTTAIFKACKFAAIDSRWTDMFDYPVETITRKYVYANEELYLFSGDHLPIILEQALLIQVISEEDFLRFYDRLDPDDVFGCLAIDEHSGRHLDEDGYAFDWHYGIAHTGSGGIFASNFYYYAKRHRYLSVHGCNIDRALNYAFHWDKCSGAPVKKKIWGRRAFDNTQQTGLDYRTFIEQEINSYFRGRAMDHTLKSSMRTSPAPNGVKVSLYAAKSRLAKRKARLAEKKS